MLASSAQPAIARRIDGTSWVPTGMRIAGVIGIALVLGSCQLMPQPKHLRGCTRIYQPVCAFKAGRRQTFSNICVAESESASGISRGECRR